MHLQPIPSPCEPRTVRHPVLQALYLICLLSFAISQQGQRAAAQANDLNLRYTEETSVETPAGKPSLSTHTVYVKGNLKRIDAQDGRNSTILQCDRQQYLSLNHVRKTCCIKPLHITTPGVAPDTKAERTPRKGGLVVHEADYRDTGERRDMFGLTARHIISKSVTEAKEGSCLGAFRTETESDAWLADLPHGARPFFSCASPGKVTDAVTSSPDRLRPDCEDNNVHNVKGDSRGFHKGFRLSARTSTTNNGRTVISTTTVTDLSFAPLEVSLFEAPPNCNCPSDRAPASRSEIKITETQKEIRIELASDILFDFNESAIRSEAEAQLGKVAELIKKYQGVSVLVEGHTDSIGTDASNLRLSEQRAASVKHWLVGSTGGASFETKGWGASKPVAPNRKPDGSDDPEGRQKNRRVEITVRK